MRKNGETYARVVSDPVEDGKSIENYPNGEALGVTVDIKGMSALADFEVIEIVDDSNPYPALFGINWATDMNVVINLKKQNMIFENKSLRIVVLLDHVEGLHYTERVRDYESDDDLDQIYKITS